MSGYTIEYISGQRVLVYLGCYIVEFGRGGEIVGYRRFR